MFQLKSCKHTGCAHFAVHSSDYCFIHSPNRDDLAKHTEAIFTPDAEINSFSMGHSLLKDKVCTNSRILASNLYHMIYENVDFSGSFFRLCFFQFSHFYNCSFKDCTIHYSIFAGSTFDNCDFTGSDILHTNFEGITASKTQFSDTDLYYSNFVSSDLHKVDFIDCNLKKTDFYNSKREEVNFKYSNVEEAHFERREKI